MSNPIMQLLGMGGGVDPQSLVNVIEYMIHTLADGDMIVRSEVACTLMANMIFDHDQACKGGDEDKHCGAEKDGSHFHYLVEMTAGIYKSMLKAKEEAGESPKGNKDLEQFFDIEGAAKRVQEQAGAAIGDAILNNSDPKAYPQT